MKSHDTRAALDALLAGQEPPATQTKVFGCSNIVVKPIPQCSVFLYAFALKLHLNRFG